MVHHVNTVRGVARWILRTVVIILAVVGIYLILRRLTLAAFIGDASMAFQIWRDIGDDHAGARGTAMLLIAFGLAFTGDRLVRWAIPVPPEGCPRCGHRRDPSETRGDGIDAGTPRCPECGLPWTVGPPGAR